MPVKKLPPYDLRVSESQQNDERKTSTKSGRFSLHNLSAAFARLTGASEPQAAADGTDESQARPATVEPLDSEALSPRMIVEGMLFVGNADGRPLTAREMAAHIRDVSPREVEALIAELNELYANTGTAFRIVSAGKGYRFVLDDRYDVVRQRFHGKVREAKLTPTSIEVLSVVAYRQPINAEEVSKLRGGRSHSLLNQLVRRGLLRLERPERSPRQPLYWTTDRFNTLFKINSPTDLPSSEDLDDN